MSTEYRTVIGLEVHVELATKTKIFCGCTNCFGGAPNTHVCPVCSGMPGSLPRLNKKCIDFAVMAGLALNCKINLINKFDRKNYFYPDLPKAYQISQSYAPICQKGFMEIQTENGIKKIGITEIHLEEDAGKLLHDPVSDNTFVDYNRCGTPLIEIVSEPDFSNADEVIAYLEKLRELLLYLGVSDCKMQEGSMRADVNLSVCPKDSDTFGVRTEMKNLNSFKAIHKAIIFEQKRQIEVIERGGFIVQETRRWDDNKEESYSMRSKENAKDYRYFPEPDLLTIKIEESRIAEIKANMPETAEQKRDRYISEFGLSEYDASVLTARKPLADLFEKTNSICNKPKDTCDMITGEIMRLMKETSTTADDLKLDGEKLAVIIELIDSAQINRAAGKTVLEAVFKEDADPNEYVKANGLMMIKDDGLVERTIDEVLAENPKSIEDYKNGKEKAYGFFVGQTMKRLGGKADPKAVNRILTEKLNQYL